MPTKIRLVSNGKSDPVIHCLLFSLHVSEAILYVEINPLREALCSTSEVTPANLKALCESLCSHKVCTKNQCVFYLNYHKISIKSYVVDLY